MARYESQFEAAGEADVAVDELLGALGPLAEAGPASRARAIANCLSAGEGWRDFAAELGGAFAALAPAPGLTGDKDK